MRRITWIAFAVVSALPYRAMPETFPPVGRLIVSIPPGTLQLDPHLAVSSSEAQVFTAIYEGLLRYDPRTLDPIPAVASAWEISEDGRKITFFLRTEARFDSGDAVLAADFRDSWLELLAPETKSHYAFLLDAVSGAREYRIGRGAAEDVGIRVLAARVLEVRLNVPTPYFFKILPHFSLAPLHPTRRSARSETSDSSISLVIGNGPYALSTVETDGSIIFRKSPNYWGSESVEIDEIAVRAFDDPVTASTGFNGGYVHWSMESFDVATVSDVSSIRVNTLFSTNYLFFRTNTPPWADERVRKAFVLALPLEKLRDEYANLLSTSSLIPPLHGYPAVRGIEESDPIESSRLLEDAAFSPVLSLRRLGIAVFDDEGRGIAEQLRATWRDSFDTDVRIEQIGRIDLIGSATENITVGVMNWIGDFADPLAFLSMWSSDNGLNPSEFADARYDAILARAAIAPSGDRYRILAEAERMLLETAVVVPIYHASAINLVDLDRVDGWYTNPLNIHPFRDLRFREFPPPANIAFGPHSAR